MWVGSGSTRGTKHGNEQGKRKGGAWEERCTSKTLQGGKDRVHQRRKKERGRKIIKTGERDMRKSMKEKNYPGRALSKNHESEKNVKMFDERVM